MDGFKLLVLCAVFVAASCQGPQVPNQAHFCLELLRSQNKQETANALVRCLSDVKKAEERAGREFKLSPPLYDTIGQCIAVRVGVLDGFGRVNKQELERRVRASQRITEQERQFYLGLVPTCEDWNSCLKQRCRL